MGTLIQSYELGEADYRGERFADHSRDLRGDSEVLSLIRPDVVLAIHGAYLDAGADIIETNTFTANRIAQADYGLSELVREMNETAARLAREAADRRRGRRAGAAALRPGRPRPDQSNGLDLAGRRPTPGARNVTFDELAVAYQEAAEGLVDGGADLLVIETIFDTLNAKAAIYGLEAAFDALGDRVPLIISGTITDASGRTLSGQTVEAFWTSVRACPADRGRAQLRTRCPPASGPHRRPRTDRRDPRQRLPERRPAQRIRRLRRAAGHDRRAPRPVRPRRAGQHRRRLLRDDAGPRPGDRRGGRRRPARGRSRSSSRRPGCPASRP